MCVKINDCNSELKNIKVVRFFENADIKYGYNGNVSMLKSLYGMCPLYIWLENPKLNNVS